MNTELQKVVSDPQSEPCVQCDLLDMIVFEKTTITKVEANVKHKLTSINKDQESKLSLAELKKDKWLNTKLNLHVVRDQVLDKLHNHRMWFEVLNHKVTSHTLDQWSEAQVHDVLNGLSIGLGMIVTHFNNVCKVLLLLQGKGNISPNVFVPEAIDMEGIYKMDVDAKLWFNADNEDICEFPNSEVPPWLLDVKVHKVIPHAQEIMNCEEELCHLGVEYQALAVVMVLG